jgi:hypothetical protein
MKTTRFRELLSAISVKEYEQFDEFIQSPFFCKNARALRVWEHINSARKEDCNYPETELAAAAFGSEKHTAANFRMLLADFCRLIEQYLLYKESAGDRQERDFKMLELSIKLKLPKSYGKYKRVCTAHIDTSEQKDMEYYYMQYLAESSKLITGDEGDFSAADEAITNALIAAKFENAVRARGNSNKRPVLLDEIIEFVKANERVYKKMHPLIYKRMHELTSEKK